MVPGIGNVDVAGGIGGHAQWLVKLPLAVALPAADGQQERATGIELLDAVIGRVGYPYIPRRIDCQPPGLGELAIAGPTTTEGGERDAGHALLGVALLIRCRVGCGLARRC